MTGTATASVAKDNIQAPGVLMQMLTGFWVSQSICAAAKLGIADQLKEGARPVSELAKALNAHEENLYRLMRALASLGIFRETENRVFELTPLAELLRSDAPNSMRPMALMLGAENYTAWGQVARAVQFGESPFESAYGMPVYEYFGTHPESAENFNQAMTALVTNDNAAILESYDFDRFSSIVDVGGGHGTLLTAILKRYTKPSAVLFDLSQVAESAALAFKEAGLSQRCDVQSGDFFGAVPSGGDAYILSRVLHGFSDEHSGMILKNIHAVIPSSGKLLLMEFILEPGNDPSTARTKLMDVNMMVFAPGGRDRTLEEYTQLLRNAGFELSNVIPTTSGIVILEAVKL